MLIYVVAKTLVLDLVLALQSQPAARILPSRNSRGTLLGDLSGYVTLVDSNNFDIQSAIPLVERVINNGSVLGYTTRINSLYNLQLHASSAATAAPAIQGAKVSVETWHRRPAHLGLRDIKKLSKCVAGIDIQGLYQEAPNHICETCMQAKQKTAELLTAAAASARHR